MSLSSRTIESLSAVEAELNYLTPRTTRPRTYTDEPPPGIPRTNIVPEPHCVSIRDARPVASIVSLEREGFGLVRHRTKVGDFSNDDEIRQVYYPEAVQLLKSLTLADRVFIFDHTVRRHIPGAPDRGNGPRQPVTRVHVDHTAKSGPQRVHDLLPNEAGALLRGRVQIINLWRPIVGPVRDAPLAVCDALSVAPDHLVPSDLIYPHRVGETYSVTFDHAHRWFYVPEMEPDEVLLLKCYDSEADGRARFVPHSAFNDPTVPANAPPRQSIELRSLVFHHVSGELPLPH